MLWRIWTQGRREVECHSIHRVCRRDHGVGLLFTLTSCPLMILPLPLSLIYSPASLLDIPLYILSPYMPEYLSAPLFISFLPSPSLLEFTLPSQQVRPNTAAAVQRERERGGGIRKRADGKAVRQKKHANFSMLWTDIELYITT